MKRAGLFLLVFIAAGALHAFAQANGGIEEYALPTPFSYPVDITVDKEGRVWFIAQNAQKLGLFDVKEKKFSEFELPKGADPAGIWADDKGLIWFSLSSKAANAIGSFSPETKKISVHKVPTIEAEPYMIASSPDGAIWFTERNANRIGRLKDNKVKEYKIPTPNSQPTGIAVDSKGSVWFTEAVGNNIGKIDLEKGKITEYRIPTGYANPADIVVDSKDMVWFVEMNGNRLVMFDTKLTMFNEAIIPTTNAVPVGLSVSSDGTVWFTESRAGKVGSFDPVKAEFKEYSIPTPASLPIGIAVDASGRVWFTEAARDANRIGTITPGALPPRSGAASANKELHR